ncbi:hypothetical protein [Desulfosporosinus meridiei]|uniref:Uncharacterized protein n=1 Tax=Desulfosporosinus meridiei (strain ATCC BAA-275 / DSM 13257 / KCTC 12902 / NCIMB 13706 / S10) TaxID=768704 RepID=J7IX29_DESMD|nr:hypothetical protein [Desulfosporosinus meridiei]AFQ43271.1 hypothetical protein Desmer_1256 [Desulfosporosinus meridiei DSM 13257]
MRGRYYVIDNRKKKINENFNPTTKGTAAIYYLRTPNNYTATVLAAQEDRRRGIISASIIVASLFIYTIIIMVTNYN